MKEISTDYFKNINMLNEVWFNYEHMNKYLDSETKRKA